LKRLFLNRELGRAEALRRAMIAYLNDASDPRLSGRPFVLDASAMSEIRTSDPLVVYTTTQTNFYPRPSLTSIRAIRLY
jgi:hypothetical protein